MKVARKVKKDNGRRQIYIFGIKICSYPGKNLRAQNKRKRECEGRKKLREVGVNTTIKRNPRIIVSLTSYHLRIGSIYPCLYSLLTQTVKPDKLILWLSIENFPNKEADIPEDILSLREQGLTICWTRDLKSYKKLIPALKLYPKDIIVTADDDLIYSRRWLEKLYTSHLQFPKDINVHSITRFELHDGRWVTMGRKAYENGSFLNKLRGGAGALYPPGSLYKDVTNEQLFMRLAPTNDDQWFWFQAILNNVKVREVANNITSLIYTKDSQEVGLVHINDRGPNLFWKDFDRLIEHYPIAEKRMLQEFKERSLAEK